MAETVAMWLMLIILGTLLLLFVGTVIAFFVLAFKVVNKVNKGDI